MRYILSLILSLVLLGCTQARSTPSATDLQVVNGAITNAAVVAQLVCDLEQPDKSQQCRDALIPVVDGSKALAQALMAQDPNASQLAGCVAKAVVLADARYQKLGVEVPELRYAAIVSSFLTPMAGQSCNPMGPDTVTTVRVPPSMPDPFDAEP